MPPSEVVHPPEALHPPEAPRLSAATAHGVEPARILLAAGTVVCGGMMTGGSAALDGMAGTRLAVAALVAVCLGGAAYGFAALRHHERLSRAFALGGTALGLGVAVFLSPLHGVMAAGAALLLYIYLSALHGQPTAGALALAFVAVLALLFGGWTFGATAPVLPAAVFAALTVFAAARLGGSRAGEGTATETAVLVGTLCLTPVPYLFFGYGGLFLVLALLTDTLLLWALWLLSRPEAQARAAVVIGWATALGLLAFALGGVVE